MPLRYLKQTLTSLTPPLPMKRISTRIDAQCIDNKNKVMAAPAVKNNTIAFLRQFARAYIAVPKMHGLVIN